MFAQTYYWIVSCGGHAYGAKSSARICKIKVSPQLLMVETHVVGKGWPRTNPHCNFTSMYDDRHFVRTGCVSWTSIHAALPLEEKKLETIKVVGVCKKLISTCVFTSATSHLHISTSRFQKRISACIYITSALHLHMAYILLVAVLRKILSTCVFELKSAPERLSVRFMFASTPVYISFIL